MAYSSGLFHVITHAFFKALLFLGAGSVIHAMSGDQDIRNMGGLWSKIKITAITFLIGTVAISGIPPFSGFFSKDEILSHVYEHNKIMWTLGLLGSFMTAFYMFRLFFVAFRGSFRGTEEQRHHLHESPNSMTTPLIVLALLSAIGGFIGFPEVFHLPHRLNEFLSPIFENSRLVNSSFGTVHVSHNVELILMGSSVLVAVVAIALAYMVFGNGKNVPVADNEVVGLKKLVYNKYFIDELYNRLFVGPISAISVFFANIVENKIIDKAVESVGAGINFSSKKIKELQVGVTGTYILFMTLGILLLVLYQFGPSLLSAFNLLQNK